MAIFNCHHTCEKFNRFNTLEMGRKIFSAFPGLLLSKNHVTQLTRQLFWFYDWRVTEGTNHRFFS